MVVCFCLSTLSKAVFLLLSFSIDIVNAEERSCEGGDLAEADEERLVDLSLRVDEHPAEEHRQSSEGEQCGGKELYVLII